MELYQSAFLSIQQENDTLVQTWSEQQLDVEDYKRELGTFMELFRKAKPSKLVWDTRKCQLVIPHDIEAWMGEQVLIPNPTPHPTSPTGPNSATAMSRPALPRQM